MDSVAHKEAVGAVELLPCCEVALAVIKSAVPVGSMGEAVASKSCEPEGTRDTEGRVEGDVDKVVDVDGEAEMDAAAVPLPPTPLLAVGRRDWVAGRVTAPVGDPDPVLPPPPPPSPPSPPRVEGVTLLDFETLVEGLEEPKVVPVGHGVREVEGKPEADPLAVLLALPPPPPPPTPTPLLLRLPLAVAVGVEGTDAVAVAAMAVPLPLALEPLGLGEMEVEPLPLRERRGDLVALGEAAAVEDKVASWAV